MAASLNILVLFYANQGQYAQAEPLSKRALAIREKALGSNHPDVATALRNLAQLYRATKRIAEAEQLEERAAKIKANDK
ncbi:tetratricopeptide repeat protein [Chloracidobacterium thermophilum]|uniref:tetratricopeptide repeat protein n=1 Tax=Chloracidobacterium thermophilum TaxID=458033 RepID=UPI00321FEA71